uniref:Secreted protein n=1 Tax=Ascaris lumbricoides TaxID=6252 RepID=A0A0M3HYC8_ASCLU
MQKARAYLLMLLCATPIRCKFMGHFEQFVVQKHGKEALKFLRGEDDSNLVTVEGAAGPENFISRRNIFPPFSCGRERHVQIVASKFPNAAVVFEISHSCVGSLPQRSESLQFVPIVLKCSLHVLHLSRAFLERVVGQSLRRRSVAPSYLAFFIAQLVDTCSSLCLRNPERSYGVRSLVELLYEYSRRQVDVISVAIGTVVARKAILGGSCYDKDENLGKAITHKFFVHLHLLLLTSANGFFAERLFEHCVIHNGVGIL